MEITTKQIDSWHAKWMAESKDIGYTFGETEEEAIANLKEMSLTA